MTDWRKQIVKTNQAFRNAISFSNNSEELVNDFLALFIQPLFSFCCVQTKYQIITESPDLQLPFHLIGLAIKALLPNNSGEKKKDTFPCSRLFGHYLGWIESLKIRWTQTEFCCCPTQSEHQILYKDIHTYIRIHIRIHAQSLELKLVLLNSSTSLHCAYIFMFFFILKKSWVRCRKNPVLVVVVDIKLLIT